MGLKNDVRKALGQTSQTNQSDARSSISTAQPEVKPVAISPEAVLAMSTNVRRWSGWSDATLLFGKPTASPHAQCDHETHTFTANAETLVLNPNRVLLTVTPFRLRQEAVLTGCLLHEAGHARHSHWLPRTEAEMLSRPLVHKDGSTPTSATIALARLMEEPRVEGLMARDADSIGATGLGWTMRASAAHLVPTTVLNTVVPEQKIMDLITSWALRAGRQIALAHYTDYTLPHWVGDYNALLHQVLVAHLTMLPSTGEEADLDPTSESQRVMSLLIDMTAALTTVDPR